jgi:hypothetical protein
LLSLLKIQPAEDNQEHGLALADFVERPVKASVTKIAAVAVIRSLTMPNRKSSSWAAMFLVVSAASRPASKTPGMYYRRTTAKPRSR